MSIIQKMKQYANSMRVRIQQKNATYAGMPMSNTTNLHTSEALGACEERRFSIIMPVYQIEDSYLNAMLHHYSSMDTNVKKVFEIILIDDASPLPVQLPRDIDLNVTVYRVLDDISWNIPGARNLGATCADTEALVFVDLDHLFPAQTLHSLACYALADKDIVMFTRYKDQVLHRMHPATFFMKKKLFLQMHGCDEDFAGNYGSDGHWRACISAYGCNVYPTDLRIDTYSKITYQHDLVRDTSHNDKIMAEKNTAPLVNHSKKMLRFAWEFAAQSRVKSTLN